MTITQEIDAGACGLDGSELTEAVLQENRSLIDEKHRLQRDRNGWAKFSIAGWIVALTLTILYSLK